MIVIRMGGGRKGETTANHQSIASDCCLQEISSVRQKIQWSMLL
jgi:hypothetical protein